MASTRFLWSLLLSAVLLGGCSAKAEDSAGADESAIEAADVRFTESVPLSDAKLEAMRRGLAESAMGYSWVGNQSTTFAVTITGGPKLVDLDAHALAAVVQQAFVFHRRLGDPSVATTPRIHGLGVVAKSDDGLGRGLDRIGLTPDGPDARTATQRAALQKLLHDATLGNETTVFDGALRDEPDMMWEGVLVVVDAAHGELLFATGGYGT